MTIAAALPIATPAPLLLNIHVLGVPKTKGSLRHVGGGRMLEQVKGSPDWRRAVAGTAHEAIICRCTTPGCHKLQDGYPYTGPVEVEIRLRFDKPKSAPKRREILPTTRTTGDADKHARNIFDALQDAGVIKDDAQIVDHRVSKRYCRPSETPGAQIVIRPVDPETAR